MNGYHEPSRAPTDRCRLGRLLARLFVFLSTVSVAFAGPVAAQDAGPRVLVAAPLGVFRGETARIVLRGAGLDTAENVQIEGLDLETKLAAKGKANVPGGLDAAKVGDTEATIELTLPEDFQPIEIALIVKTSAGTSKPYKLLVDATDAAVAEKEPNDGFDMAQSLGPGQVVLGAIDQGKNVDVFRIEATAGQQLTAEAFAVRLGSALDPTLALYDAKGNLLERDDDAVAGGDALLRVVAPADGAYYVSLGDANDSASPAHVYRLVVRVEK